MFWVWAVWAFLLFALALFVWVMLLSGDISIEERDDFDDEYFL